MQVSEDVGDAPDAAGDEAGHEEEAEELLRIELPILEHAGALEQHDGDCAENHDDDEAGKRAPPECGAEGDAPHFFYPVAVAGDFIGLPGKRLDADDAGQRFTDDGVGPRHGVLRLLGQLADEPAETHCGEHGHGQGAEHQQGEFPAEGHQGQQTAPDDDGLADQLGEDHGEGVADGLDVGGDAAAQVPNTAGVEEGHGLGDHAGEGILPQCLEHARGDFPEQPDPDEAQGALDDQDEENGHPDLFQVAGIDGQGQVKSSLSRRGIHADTTELSPEAGHHEGQDAGQGDEHNAGGEFEPVRAQVGRDPSELPESVAVQFALPGRGGVGVGGWGVASGQCNALSGCGTKLLPMPNCASLGGVKGSGTQNAGFLVSLPIFALPIFETPSS